MTPTVEYGSLGGDNYPVDSVLYPNILPNILCLIGKDEPYPLNLSRYFWLLSNESQRCFEARVMQYGRN